MQRSSRFPIHDGLGIYCWFCGEFLDTSKSQVSGYPTGEGRYGVSCPDCRQTTSFDCLDELLRGPTLAPAPLGDAQRRLR